MSNRRNGPVKRAAVRLLAEEQRIPITAAASKYACMSIERKQALCARVERMISQTQARANSPAPSL